MLPFFLGSENAKMLTFFLNRCTDMNPEFARNNYDALCMREGQNAVLVVIGLK